MQRLQQSDWMLRLQDCCRFATIDLEVNVADRSIVTASTDLIDSGNRLYGNGISPSWPGIRIAKRNEPGCAANTSQSGCERHSRSIGLKSSPCSGRKYRSHGWRPENCVLLDGGSQKTQPDAQVPRQRRAGIALHDEGSTAIGLESCMGNPWKTSFLEEVQTDFEVLSVFCRRQAGDFSGSS